MSDKLLTVKDAATWLGVSEKTIWNYSAPRGPLPVVRIGSRTLIDPVDLRTFAEKMKVTQKAEPPVTD